MANRTELNVGVTKETKGKVEEMAEYLDESLATVVAGAIHGFYATFARQRAQSEAKARRGMALLERLEERLGKGFYEDGVGFETTPDDRLIIHAGDLRYFQADNSDKLVAARGRGGRAEFAEVTDDGLGPWVATSIADPNMN